MRCGSLIPPYFSPILAPNPYWLLGAILLNGERLLLETQYFALEALLRTEIVVIINSRPWSTKKVGHTSIQKDLVLYIKRVLYLGVVQYDREYGTSAHL